VLTADAGSQADATHSWLYDTQDGYRVLSGEVSGQIQHRMAIIISQMDSTMFGHNVFRHLAAVAPLNCRAL